MKTFMKFVCLKALLFLMSTSAAAVTINQQAFNYFTDANGNVGFVFVDRKTDPVTNVSTTTLSYSFCVQTTAASCLEGSGVIPNSAFTGKLIAAPFIAQTVKLLADTTIPGFSNDLCNGPDPFGGCAQGKSPATGGPITLTYVTTRGWIESFTFNDWKRENFIVVRNSFDVTSQGPASVQGTVLGTSVKSNNKGASWGIEAVSGLGSPGAKVQLAQSHLTLDKSLTPQALSRLQRLTGKKAVE